MRRLVSPPQPGLREHQVPALGLGHTEGPLRARDPRHVIGGEELVAAPQAVQGSEGQLREPHAGALQVCLIPLFLLASYIVKGQREVEKM